MQPAVEIRFLNLGGQPSERLERQQVPHSFQPLALAVAKRLDPGRQRAVAETRKRPIGAGRQHAQPCPRGFARFILRESITARQQFRQESTALLPGHLDSRRAKEAAPESLARSLLAGSEQGPAYPPLIVLSPRQGHAQQEDIALVMKLAGASRQGVRPVGVVAKLAPRDVRRWFAATEPNAFAQGISGELFDSGRQLLCFLILRDVPAEVVRLLGKLNASLIIRTRRQAGRR